MPNRRIIVIAASVVFFHLAALWALQNGLLYRPAERVVPVELLTRIIEIAPPRVAPPPPPSQERQQPPPPAPPAPPVPAAQAAAAATKTAGLPPPPLPAAVLENTPAPQAPTGRLESPLPAPVVPAPLLTAPAPAAPPAPARLVEITQGETDYIRPPRPVYPALSKRSGEAGVVIVAVYYGSSGHAKRAEVFKSSGFDRLDRAARDAVLASQVTPFRRAGVNDDTEFLLKAPINFVLE